MLLYFLYILVFFLCIICAINGKKNTLYYKLILGVAFIFMLVIAGWSRGAYDIEIGISRYVNYQNFSSFTEPGYTSLVTFCNSIGMPYRLFFVLSTLFELLVLFWFADKYSEKPVNVILLFLIYPFVIFFQYSRNILAFAFVLLAIDSLLEKRKLYSIRFFILILVAASIHLNSLFFISYYLLDVWDEKKVAIGAIVSSAFLYLATKIDFFYNIVNRLLGETKKDILLNSVNATGTFGRIFGLAAAILFFFIAMLVLNKLYKVDLDDDKTQFMKKVNTMSIILIPLTMRFGVGFARMQTLIMPLNFIWLVSSTSKIIGQRKRLSIYIIMAVYLFCLMYINVRNEAFMRLVIDPFFYENELIAWLFS